MVSGDEIRQQSACRLAQLIDRMNRARRGMIHATSTFDMRVFSLESGHMAYVPLKCGSIFSKIVPLTREPCPVLRVKPLCKTGTYACYRCKMFFKKVRFTQRQII